MNNDELVARTRAHYRDKFAAHGATPLGVDWNGAASQLLQFEQLLKLLPAVDGPIDQGAGKRIGQSAGEVTDVVAGSFMGNVVGNDVGNFTGNSMHDSTGHPTVRFTVNDFGCGYGALADLLLQRRAGVGDFAYRGYDLNAEMIAAASQRHAAHPQLAFELAGWPTADADYGMASGVFTLRLGRSDAQCRADMVDALDALHATSRLGFGFNCLTAYSDADKMKGHLYYPDPCDLFDLCKRRFARNVALLHDYGLYAFTVLVRKSLPAAA